MNAAFTLQAIIDLAGKACFDHEMAERTSLTSFRVATGLLKID